MAAILSIRPGDDAAALLVAEVGGRISRHVQNQIEGWSDHSIHNLSGSTAVTRAAVDAELLRGYDHLFFFGHGAPDALRSGGSTLVDITNIGLLPPTSVVIAMACFSLSGLGVASAGEKVRAYLGWSDELLISNYNPTPMLDALFDGISVLFKGEDLATCEAALQHALDEALEVYRNWEPTSKAGQAAKLLAKMTVPFAAVCVGVEGDDSATL